LGGWGAGGGYSQSVSFTRSDVAGAGRRRRKEEEEEKEEEEANHEPVIT
jgi:hypothetical protein